MIVTLIPFFLTASIGLNGNDNNWKYGPKVIYDVRVDSASYPTGQSGNIITISNMTTKLDCRPKSFAILSCHFHEAKFVISTIKPSGKSQIFRIKKEDICDDIFELNYDKTGLESIDVSSSIESHKLDMIRALVGQLNVGGNFVTLIDERFEFLENFTTGSCKTNYFLSIDSTNNDEIVDDRNNGKSDDFMIISGRQITSSKEIVEILRTRDLDRCRDLIDYFFGSRHDQGIEFSTKIKSSKSFMSLRNRDFTSWTENSIVVSSKLLSISTALVERITLGLEKIVPASEPLPMMSDPSTRSIFPGR